MTSIRQFFEHQHQKPLPVWLWLFSPLCLFYYVAVLCRQWLYKMGILNATKVSVPVISIGNLTTGGTGKTPVVIALSQYLVRHHTKVVVLSRGYGAKLPQDYTQASTPDYGDEAFLIQQAVPEAVVIVGRKRRENALKAIQDYSPDVIILDDGFQYLPLQRDINLILVDGEQGFGNGMLLPLGPLREALKNLNRATAIAITKHSHPEQLKKINLLLESHSQSGVNNLPNFNWPFEPRKLYSPSDPSVTLESHLISKQFPLALCGIARPSAFINSLNVLGIDILAERQFAFSDHHDYALKDIDAIQSKHPNSLIITTEKDWVKLQAIIPENQWHQWVVLQVMPNINPKDWQRLLSPIYQDLAMPMEKVIAT